VVTNRTIHTRKTPYNAPGQNRYARPPRGERPRSPGRTHLYVPKSQIPNARYELAISHRQINQFTRYLQIHKRVIQMPKHKSIITIPVPSWLIRQVVGNQKFQKEPPTSSGLSNDFHDEGQDQKLYVAVENPKNERLFNIQGCISPFHAPSKRISPRHSF